MVGNGDDDDGDDDDYADADADGWMNEVLRESPCQIGFWRPMSCVIRCRWNPPQDPPHTGPAKARLGHKCGLGGA